MSIALDPSEMRTSVEGRAPATPRAPSRVGRLALITVLGGVGLVGLSAGAYSMLSGLAGPPPSKVRMGRVSADWPDLRDGVPALAPAHRPSGPVPNEAAAPDSMSLKAVPAPVQAKPTQVAGIAPVTKPARLLVIENAATVPAAPAVALVEKARTAPLVAPTSVETTRARATTAGTFAALPPERTLSDAAPKAKAASVAAPIAARTKPVAKAAPKPAPATAGTAATAQPTQAAEPEAEETQMFGMKVPSLAPVGRKFVEGVEALGNAVKRFPERF